MRAKVVVRSLNLNDGQTVPVPATGVVLVVGPNNSGKSQALRDISKAISSDSEAGIVVESADIDFSGTADELLATFEEDRAILRSPTAGDRVALGTRGAQPVSTTIEWWSSRASYIVGGYFTLFADTENRLEASKPTTGIDLYAEDPQHPLHHLYARRSVEERLNEISQEAFGQGVFLDTWGGGTSWSLRVGNIETPNNPRPTQEFLDSIQQAPLLREQGDGVRSMIGLLLNLFTGHQSVSLIDEPEAFLHPPQARYLARILSEDAADSGYAAFMSTHSADIVHGTLEGRAPTTVIRLVREGDVNHASVLDNEAVRRLWGDPLLRYSNLLEGLFSDAAIVCESDADCKFWASIWDSLERQDGQQRRPDLLFTSCGGKHRMHVAVEALRAARVPVVALGDFDVLNDWSVVSRLVRAAGGDPAELEQDWKVLNSALTSNSRTPSVAGMREAVDTAFSAVTEVTMKALAPVREAMKIENGWDRVKNAGMAGVPKGDQYAAGERLVAALGSLRIHVAPVGEMEDFVPAVGGHGPGWVADVLEQHRHESSDTDGAREFFRKVVGSLD